MVTLQIVDYEVVEKKIAVGKTIETRRERVKQTRDVPSGHSEKNVKSAMDVANKIWAKADITFQLRNTFFPTSEAPGNLEEVSVSGFFRMLTTLKIKAMGGVSALFVKKFENIDVGGFAAEKLGACILPSLSDPWLGKTLAHELGHLLSLPDLVNPPNQAMYNYNLMYGALRPNDDLTPDPNRKST
jgi:hypothetical protein